MIFRSKIQEDCIQIIKTRNSNAAECDVAKFTFFLIYGKVVNKATNICNLNIMSHPHFQIRKTKKISENSVIVTETDVKFTDRNSV